MSFKTTKRPTPYGYFDSDVAFQVDADAFLHFASRTLGAGVLSVELERTIYWTNLEAAVIKWCNLISEYEITSQIADLIGKPRPIESPVLPGESGNISGQLIQPTNNYAERYSFAWSRSTGYSGDFSVHRGVIIPEVGKQTYDIKEDLKDLEDYKLDPRAEPSDVRPLWKSPINTVGKTMKILDVYHFDSGQGVYGWNPRSAIQDYLVDVNVGRAGLFAFSYIRPVFDDLVRGQHLKSSRTIRKSHYTWRIRGTTFYMYPRPLEHRPVGPVFVDVTFIDGSLQNGLDGTQPPDYASSYSPDSPSTGLITNLSNVPMGLYHYSSINSIGREWIKDYALSLCKISLGNIRGKYSSMPVPSDTMSLNGGDMVAQGQSERDSLIANLRERLQALTSTSILERRAAEAESTNQILSYSPPKKAIYIG